MNQFDHYVREKTGQDLWSDRIHTFQVNVGLRCNQACHHCHVVSSPKRKETMTWDIMELILDAVRKVGCSFIDITGGAPELNPDFCRFITALRRMNCTVQVRTNLTVLLEEGMDYIVDFYREHEIALIASLPCYLQKNVDKQRGRGVHEKSITVLRKLNRAGYGIDVRLPLFLVYNPLSPVLPPDQASLEKDYRQEMEDRFGVVFTKLLTITNMPIGRFFADLREHKKADEYMALLVDSFNSLTIDGLMCRHQINIDWDGVIYDCDFNLALTLPVNHGAPTHIRDFDLEALNRRRIVTGNHCFGCTAGRGSSCGGSLV
jgi:radical SAM/Cys-rich protein